MRSSHTRWLAATLAGLAVCTPPHYENNQLEWVVANQTADTLEVTVRLPLDSLLVPPDSLAPVRRRLARSAALSNRAFEPLVHLSQHRGRWYRVSAGWTWINPFLNTVYWRSASHVDSLAGMLTYRLPPQQTQQLGLDAYDVHDYYPARPALALTLRQGASQRQLPLGADIDSVFLPQPIRPESGRAPRYCRQLTVRPGLALH